MGDLSRDAGVLSGVIARAPLHVLSGLPPRLQENRGALQDMVHTDLLRGVPDLQPLAAWDEAERRFRAEPAR